MKKYGNKLKGMNYVNKSKVFKEAEYTMKLLKRAGLKINPNNLNEIRL